MEGDGVKFEDGEKVEWAMAAVLRGVKEAYAAHVRVQVEQTRLELLK